MMVQSNTSDRDANDSHETNDSAQDKKRQTGQELDTDATLDTITDPVTLENEH